ncbi:prolipoprotein diacylglyceryl transferase [Acinetobacter gerneri]|jgi:phosphatidylglycerol:prolipoprotein diacylglycerol transferase|uniref:Phosphatidylglycerol--prolipoprotein diacylglyceryl transferase n=2 Tax=Acinetobacter gerneri TaxID=202952 RepID=N8YEY8_9GAMM|nr:prolipoprotein diacylglyceryl transferase [Acinetobacter gerneri]ENV35211.1 prolipoprotein diacylglyceryl transferase [Acinetobacter gerneri DSM 14967 = CIP 107464 = MTCC 9824]EPR83454.1 Prolipoprotein diacylglyceryl transferase [Acinetobacter gerneri DSM 14967 = CIP 107464 = MTCC 9824]MCH4246013.1 prolipoprotein diacylglyceryl transferase [Acinetobacter gerneri]MDQ9008836.1 prolipoprotein diacylglyceryl transferase [Acinetobacter gerneri]MDQ9012940.1 prolipoprotein diacylglyceryl transfera
MLAYPHIDPVAIALGPLKVHWYGVMYLLAFLCAWGLATYRAKHRDGWTSEMVSDLVFYGALGVVLGGRIGYVLFYEFDKFLDNPLWLFQVWTGGMSFHGGFIGVMLAMILWCRKYKKTWFQTMDFIAPCVPTGLMFGRIGNFIGGELFGRVSNGGYSWLMGFPTAQAADREYLIAHPEQQGLLQQVGEYLLLPRHPSQIYQALCEGLFLFIILWFFSAKPRPRMAVSALFLIGYGCARFFMEFFREPDADQGYILFGWMTKGQMLSFPMILIGILLMAYAYRRKIYDWGPQKNA